MGKGKGEPCGSLPEDGELSRAGIVVVDMVEEELEEVVLVLEGGVRGMLVVGTMDKDGGMGKIARMEWQMKI